MALSLNGTTGVSGVDGSASAPALKGTDTNSGISYASDTVNINTGGTTRATVDSSGNLNIPDNGKIQLGTGNDLNILHTGSASEINNTTNTELQIKNLGNNGILLKNENAYPIIFQTSATERLRIDSSGRLLLGDTSPTTGVSTGHIVSTYNGNSDNGIKTRDTSGGSCNHAVFVSQSTAVGTISGTSSAVAYNNLSDYRTKENDVKISDGITKLKLLRPIRFNFKHVPDTTVDGFFAHEVTPAVPEAVTGEKDAVDSNGEINPQMLDSSKLVPLLTAALQEAIAKIEVLETKVAALEAA